MPKPPRRPLPPSDPDIGRKVTINYRAKASCPGKTVQIKMKFKLAAGGTSIRYQCLTCKGSFHITF
jgi:hypothetical protein